MIKLEMHHPLWTRTSYPSPPPHSEFHKKRFCSRTPTPFYSLGGEKRWTRIQCRSIDLLVRHWQCRNPQKLSTCLLRWWHILAACTLSEDLGNATEAVRMGFVTYRPFKEETCHECGPGCPSTILAMTYPEWNRIPSDLVFHGFAEAWPGPEFFRSQVKRVRWWHGICE